MILNTFQLLDLVEKMKQNVIEDTSEYGGFTYKRIAQDQYEVEGVVQIQDQGKVGVIYIPKEEGQQG